jgi:hypothetical protein
LSVGVVGGAFADELLRGVAEGVDDAGAEC